jgi:hypothetical protein
MGKPMTHPKTLTPQHGMAGRLLIAPQFGEKEVLAFPE